MSLFEEVELLRDIPLFSKIDPSKLKLLAFTSERLSFKNGQIIFKEGDVGDSAYIIIDGKAVVLIDTDSGLMEIARLNKGDILGEVAILCDVPRTATVRAEDSLTTLKINKDTFFSLVSEFPQISVEIMRELATRLNRTNTKLRDALGDKSS